MMKNKHPYYILCLMALLFSSGVTETDIIYWSADYKLTWNDFQGKPRYEYSAIAALTSSGIVDYSGCKEGQIIYKIRAYFEKKNSWVKEEAYTNYHLAHEQLHFDITELYARKLRKLLSKQEFKCGQEVEFNAFIQNILELWHREQQNYDLLTHHSMDKSQQKEWVYRIYMELSLLDNYSEAAMKK